MLFMDKTSTTYAQEKPRACDRCSRQRRKMDRGNNTYAQYTREMMLVNLGDD